MLVQTFVTGCHRDADSFYCRHLKGGQCSKCQCSIGTTIIGRMVTLQTLISFYSWFSKRSEIETPIVCQLSFEISNVCLLLLPS